MSQLLPFIEQQFPTDISLKSVGGPQRRTEIVTLVSGHEQRNSRWADSRRSYNAAMGMRSIADLHLVVDFFEQCRGRLYGFRWKDHVDYSSGIAGAPITVSDQLIGDGDGATANFQLIKTYGQNENKYVRAITKPVENSVLIGVDGVVQTQGPDFTVDYTTGLITFAQNAIPQAGSQVTAGFEFDVPVRFDVDQIEISLDAFKAGQITDISIIEVKQ